MISGVAFCPQTPLLVPQVAQGAAPELDVLRAACRTAIRRAAAAADRVVIIGTGDATAEHGPTVRGSLAPYGVALDVPLGCDEAGPVELPLSLTIGGWLVRDALGPNTGTEGRSVGADRSSTLRLPDEPTALIVMGDGSARRSENAPGYLDERAGRFDDHVTAALADGDASALARLDLDLAADLLAAGGPAWLAAGHAASRSEWKAELLYADAPYGIGYFVAVWTSRA